MKNQGEMSAGGEETQFGEEAGSQGWFAFSQSQRSEQYQLLRGNEAAFLQRKSILLVVCGIYIAAGAMGLCQTGSCPSTNDRGSHDPASAGSKEPQLCTQASKRGIIAVTICI